MHTVHLQCPVALSSNHNPYIVIGWTMYVAMCMVDYGWEGNGQFIFQNGWAAAPPPPPPHHFLVGKIALKSRADDTKK